LWEAGFITLTKKADRFVIEKGELVLDLSLIADADDPQIPPSLSPIRIRGAILDQFEITSPVTLKVEVDPATGRHIYIVEDGELVDAQTDEAYSADSLIFAHDSELVPIMDPGQEQTVRWGKNGERLEHLELVDDEDAVFVWSVAAVAEPPTWAWQEPANNITYSLTPEEQETYRVAQVELERTLQRLLDEEPVDLQAIRNLLQAEDASMIQFESKLYPIDSLAVRDIDGIPHLVTMVDPSERQQAQGYEPRFTILYPPSVLEMGPTRFEDIFGDALGVHSGNFITAFQATSAGGTQVEIHYEIGFHKYLRDHIAIEYTNEDGEVDNAELATLFTEWAADICEVHPTARDSSVMRWAMEYQAKVSTGNNLVPGVDALRAFPYSWTAEESQETGLPMFGRIVFYVVNTKPPTRGRWPIESWTLPLKAVDDRQLVTLAGTSLGHDRCVSAALALVTEGSDGEELYIIYSTDTNCQRRYPNIPLGVSKWFVNRMIVGLGSMCIEPDVVVNLQKSMQGGAPIHTSHYNNASVERFWDNTFKIVQDPRARENVGYVFVDR
jgi:hypothetical protein